MIDLNVEGISLQLQLKVEDDGSLKLDFGEGSVSMTVDGVGEMGTVKHFKIDQQMLERELGAPLSKMIRDAIHECVSPAEGETEKLCVKNLSKSENMPYSHDHVDGNCPHPDCQGKDGNDWSWQYTANSAN